MMSDRQVLAKLKGARSDRTVRRIRKQWIDASKQERDDSLDSPLIDDPVDLNSPTCSLSDDEPISDEMMIDGESKTSNDTQIEYNLDLLNDLGLSVDQIVAKKIMNFKSKFNLSNSALREVLQLMNEISQLRGFGAIVEPTMHKVKKNVQFSDVLKPKFGFKCENCESNILVERSVNKCPKCDHQMNLREKICSDHHFEFDFIPQLNLLLEHKTLIEDKSTMCDIISSVFDSDVYQRYLELKKNEQIILITFYSDGVRVSNSNSKESWPIFIKVHNIEGTDDERIFLYSNHHGHTKPDLEFYLASLIKNLNDLFINGLFINKLNRKVYPMIIINLFDLPAKSFFLNHIGHMGYFSCITCLIEGRQCTHSRKIVFKSTGDVQLRDYREYEKILSKSLPYQGVKGKSVLSNIVYLDLYKSTAIDGMHGPIGGVGKRLFHSMLDPTFVDKPCYINSSSRNVLHRRLRNFGGTSDFKRFPRDLNYLSDWKTNEYFQFIFYQSPIVLKDLLNEACYNHWLLFVYCLSKLWNGGLSRNELAFINELICQFVNDIDELYGEKEHTPNMHQLSHLTSCVSNLGPLMEYSAFIFEHFNGLLSKFTKSPYAINHQISDEYATKFCLSLIENKVNDHSWQLIGEPTIKRIQKKGKIVTTIHTDTPKTTNCFVKSKDNRFYLIEKFFKEGSIVYFLGRRLKVEEFKFKYKNQNFSLDYLHKCESTDRIEQITILMIDKKVHFVRQFAKNSSCFEYERKGHLIELKHVYHN